jgi:hypothetical protein
MERHEEHGRTRYRPAGGLGVAADMVRGSVVAQDEAVAVDDGRREAFDAAYEAIEGRRGFCLKCIAELERQCSSA